MQECDAMSSKSYDFRATEAQRLPLARSSGARCLPSDCFLRDHRLPLRSSAHTHRAVSPPSCVPVAWALSAPGAPPRAPGGIRRPRQSPVCFYAPPLCVYKRSCIKGFESAKGGGGFLPKSHRPKNGLFHAARYDQCQGVFDPANVKELPCFPARRRR